MLTGFTISLISVPLITGFALKAQIVDVPSERKIHIDNIPLLGGLGIFAAYLVVILMLDSFSVKTYALIAANLLILITGVFDDILNLNAPRKLVGQFLAASVIIYFTDFRFTISSFDLAILSHPIFNIVFTYLWIIGVTNALNLIDGMDGLAGGIAFMAFGAIGYAAYSKGFELNAYMCMALMGGTLGFLRYNIPPAKVFMGDTGSLFLGFNIAVMSIAASHKSGTVLSVLIPVMFISLPLFDTMLAIVRRTLKGQNPMSADREHLHHRLLSLEFSSVQTLMIFYSLSIALMAISIFSFQNQHLWGVILVFLVLYLFFITLKLFHLYDLGKKIRILNEKARNAALTISKKHEDFNLKTRKVDIVIAITSFAMLAKFIWFESAATYIQLFTSFIFIATIVITITYKKFCHIQNDFVSFAFFWMFFYIIYKSYHSSFSEFEVVCLSILSLCILIKIIISKQFDLFISNPMELIIIFCLMLIYLVLKITAESFALMASASLIMYYANKFFFIHSNKMTRTYTTSIIALLICFSIGSSMMLFSSDIDGARVYLTPAQMHSELKKDLSAENYAKGRELLIAYESKKPLEFMKSSFQSDGAKIYFNLIIGSLMEGELIKSDMYLREFLTMFPDLVDEFYDTFAPVIRSVSKFDVKGAGEVKIHGMQINQIVGVYAETMEAYAKSYADKGYDKKSRNYKAVASMLRNLSRKVG